MDYTDGNVCFAIHRKIRKLLSMYETSLQHLREISDRKLQGGYSYHQVGIVGLWLNRQPQNTSGFLEVLFPITVLRAASATGIILITSNGIIINLAIFTHYKPVFNVNPLSILLINQHH